jgi:hypothetical protein
MTMTKPKNDPDIFALPVHPAADVFPMLPEDELEELAESIKTQGLLNSIVVQSIDGKLVLVDGRNRREACRRAGVEPTYTLLDGQDATAYILSANVNRRHMTKGQRAIATAMIYPEAEKGGRGKKAVLNTEFSSGNLSHARTVLRHTPDAAALVLTGALSLDAAYKNAQDLLRAAEGQEEGMRRLRAEHPDLADQVIEGTLTLKEAWAVERERAEEARLHKLSFAEGLYRLEDAAHHVCNDGSIDATLKFILDDAFIYEKYAKRPISGLIAALHDYQMGIPKLIKRLAEEEKRRARKN